MPLIFNKWSKTITNFLQKLIQVNEADFHPNGLTNKTALVTPTQIHSLAWCDFTKNNQSLYLQGANAVMVTGAWFYEMLEQFGSSKIEELLIMQENYGAAKGDN